MKEKETWKPSKKLKFGKRNIKSNHIEKLKQTVDSFTGVFEKTDEVKRNFHEKSRRYNKKITDFIEKLFKMNLKYCADNDLSSLIVLMKNKNGEERFFCDFEKLNMALMTSSSVKLNKRWHLFFIKRPPSSQYQHGSRSINRLSIKPALKQAKQQLSWCVRCTRRSAVHQSLSKHFTGKSFTGKSSTQRPLGFFISPQQRFQLSSKFRLGLRSACEDHCSSAHTVRVAQLRSAQLTRSPCPLRTRSSIRVSTHGEHDGDSGRVRAVREVDSDGHGRGGEAESPSFILYFFCIFFYVLL
jgi:hypothetical protein